MIRIEGAKEIIVKTKTICSGSDILSEFSDPPKSIFKMGKVSPKQSGAKLKNIPVIIIKRLRKVTDLYIFIA